MHGAEIAVVDQSSVTRYHGVVQPGTVIRITGHLDQGDGERFKQVLSPFLNPNYDVADVRGQITVALDLPRGGDVFEAISIAKQIRENSVTTLVGEDASCISACAFIYMAGRVSLATTDGTTIVVPDRKLVAGGWIGFHSPYNDLDKGNFAEGVNAIRLLRNSLGRAMPDDLFLTALEIGRDETFDIEYVADVIRWDIEYFATVTDKNDVRAKLYNACLNKIVLKDEWTDYGPLADNVVQVRSALEVQNGDEIPAENRRVDLTSRYRLEEPDDFGVIPHDWVTIANEGSKILSEARDLLQDKDYFRVVTSRDKRMVATEVNLALGDELSSLSCTAIAPNVAIDMEEITTAGQEVFVITANIPLSEIQEEDFGRPLSNIYMFPGGMKLKDIK
ncbi:hypothetical protein [Sinorhizobium meliloti]|uniref:hypothetical protein n=1 Tax=Rhizobium meliloti TaxID=382 RepID=UPI000A6E41AC|nr:hypothetical protein [Sinorhizobium meliloti]